MQRFDRKKHLFSRESTSQVQNANNSVSADLIEACKKGDRIAQKRVFDTLAPKMFAICLRYIGDRMAAEDVLQEGFITMFSKMDMYSGEGAFEGWARKIFVNSALMSLRKTDALKMSDDLETAWNLSSNGVSQLQNIGYNELLRLISELPSGYRTVFNMYVIEGYSHKEIAEQLDISEATSRSQLQRARMILQDKIKDF